MSLIIDLGGKIAGVTFSPDDQLLWYLVEMRAEKVSNLASLEMVQNVSLAKVGMWDFSTMWWKTTKIDPLVNMIAERVVDAKVKVVINYEENKSKPGIVDEITTIVQSVGGEAMRIGLAEYILAKIPADMLDQVAKNEYVTTIEALRPISLRGNRSTQFASHSQSLLVLLLLTFVLYCFHVRKSRKVKFTLLIVLMGTLSLELGDIPVTSALNVSRFAIIANRAGNEGNGVVVAVIDTGVDFNHQHLAAAIDANIAMTGGNNPMDRRGHGTHVAGIVASRSPRYEGVAPQSRIINLKVEQEHEIRDAIQWCIDNKDAFNISIIQMSVGYHLERPLRR